MSDQTADTRTQVEREQAPALALLLEHRNRRIAEAEKVIGNQLLALIIAGGVPNVTFNG